MLRRDFERVVVLYDTNNNFSSLGRAELYVPRDEIRAVQALSRQELRRKLDAPEKHLNPDEMSVIRCVNLGDVVVWGCAEKNANYALGHSEYRCGECGLPTYDMYMVRNEVWVAAQMSPRGHLHLNCLEKRLGRPLELRDFTPAPINDLLRIGARIA